MITGLEMDAYFKNMDVPDGWGYVGRVTPCFPKITFCEWIHESGWEARIPEYNVKDFDALQFAVIDETGDLVGRSPVLP